MRTGQRGIALIKSFESCAKLRSDGKYEAYPDPRTGGDPWTIGWGSTGPGIRKGVIWSQAECDARFMQDLKRFEDDVTQLIGDSPTTQNQFDAMVSFAYNVGPDIDADLLPEGLGDSTLLRKHKAGDYAGAKAEFAKWNKSKGVVMAGLTRRRAAEAALYGDPN